MCEWANNFEGVFLKGFVYKIGAIFLRLGSNGTIQVETSKRGYKFLGDNFLPRKNESDNILIR